MLYYYGKLIQFKKNAKTDEEVITSEHKKNSYVYLTRLIYLYVF